MILIYLKLFLRKKIMSPVNVGPLGDVRGWWCDVFVFDSIRADVCRTAGERVTVKVSADPNLSTTISLVHSTRQLPPSSSARLAESPASLFPRPPGLLRVLQQQRKVYLGPRRGRIGFAHRNFYCAPLFLVRRWVFRSNAFSRSVGDYLRLSR